MKHAVSKLKPQTKNELRNVIQNVWDEFSKERINSLVASFPQRIVLVLHHQGNSIQAYLENELSSKQIVPFFPNQDVTLIDDLITDIVEAQEDEVNFEVLTDEPFSKDDDELILKHFLKFGPKWEVIAKQGFKRTPDAIKNRFNSSIKKQLHLN